MGSANTTGMRRIGSYRQRERDQIPDERKQQQKSGGRTLHSFLANPNPCVNSE
jgi:hypothetical protein